MQVIQNVAIRFANGPSAAIPNLPIVNAIAPNAPIGASRIRIFTIPNTAFVSAPMKSTSGFARAPTIESAKPKRIAINSTCRISPLAKASTTVFGMMCSRKSVTVCAFACPA